MKAITLLVLIASSLLAVEQVANVPPDYTVDTVTYDAQGKLWVLGTALGADGRPQSMVGIVEGGQIKDPLFNKVSTSRPTKRTFWEQEKSIEWGGVFSKGKTLYLQSLLGPGFPIPWPLGRPPQTYFDKVEDGVGSRICTSIGNNIGTKTLGRFSYGWVGADKEKYFVAGNRPPTTDPRPGFTFDEEYSLYRLTSSTYSGSICTFQRVHLLDKDYRVLQAWRMPDGRFLTERYRFPATKVATEVGIIGVDGKFSSLQITGEECCQLLVEPSDISATILYKSGGKWMVRAFRDGRLAGLYELSGFNNTQPVWLSQQNGPWAVFAGAGAGRQNQDTVVLMNTLTGVQKVVVSDGQLGSVAVQNLDSAHVAVSPSGEVDFLFKIGPTGTIYRERMVAIPPIITALSVSSAKITVGESVVIRWQSKNGEKARLYAGSNIVLDNLPASGEATVLPFPAVEYYLQGGGARIWRFG